MSQQINVNTDYGQEWMFSKQVAAYLGLDVRYFSEKFLFRTKDFPKSFRLLNQGHRRWLRSEIDAWIESRREAA